jgi:hypothetical protein
LAVNARAPKFPGFKDAKFREDAVSAALSYEDYVVSLDFNSWDPFPWNESWTISAYGTNGELHASLLPAKVESNLAEARAGYPAGMHVPFEAETNVAWSGARTAYSPGHCQVAGGKMRR